MAIGPNTQVSDVIVPEIFTPYVQQITEEKSRLVQSGALTRNSTLDEFLASTVFALAVSDMILSLPLFRGRKKVLRLVSLCTELVWRLS